MSAIVTIGRLTIAEAMRRRVVWVLLGLTVVSVALTGWGVDRLVTLAREDGVPELVIQVGVSQVLILASFMFSFVLAMTAAFLGAPAIAADVESGVIHSLLARPIRRTELLIGRWLGLTVIVVAYAAASGLLEIAVVRLVSGYGPPEPIVAVAFLAAQATVLLTLAIALSTRLPAVAAGAVCVVAFGLAWMAGVFAGIGRFFDAGPLVDGAEAARWLLPTDGLWRGTIFGLEPPIAVLAAVGRLGDAADANPFFASISPDPAFVVWSATWVVLVLVIAAWSLARRDL